MNGPDLKIWRKQNGYSSQDMLRRELGLGSRATVSAWENSNGPLPRILVLALRGLEADPGMRQVAGKKATATERRQLKQLLEKV